VNEPRAVAERYARRAADDLYSPLRPEVNRLLQQRQRALLQLMARAGIQAVDGLRLTEVGCGSGGNLLELLQLGFAPAHLQGIELLPERFAQARERLPAALHLVQGDAVRADVAPGSQDLVLQSTVFSSLLDDSFQQQLAGAMWRWLKPGGAVVWYDFTVDNPRNRDVRGVPVARLRQLFPQGELTARRVTLAPPLARAACRVHPWLHDALNLLPLLRTHVLAWVAKPR
jgi:SAM-dependent methyltransferase